MMKKKIVIVLFIAIGLVMGGAFSSQKADAADVSYKCYVPYCIKTGTWYTGLHFKATNFSSEVLEIKFWKDGNHYATATLNIGADHQGQWTGTVEALCALAVATSSTPLGKEAPPPAVSFQSPSMLNITSTKGKFTTTQFTGNTAVVGGGFGCQTLYAYPVSSGWPYIVPTGGEPLSEPQGEDIPTDDK